MLPTSPEFKADAHRAYGPRRLHVVLIDGDSGTRAA